MNDTAVTRQEEGVTSRPIPEASVARLPVYLRALVDMAERATHTASSESLAAAANRAERQWQTSDQSAALPGRSPRPRRATPS